MSDGADVVGVDLLYSLADSITRFMDDGPGLFASLLYLAVATIPVTLLHELGHALVAARRLGSDVEVTVGTGAKLAQVRLGQVTTALHAFSDPRRVAGSASVDDTRATARDVICIALAGPLASAAGFGVALILLSALTPGGGVLHNLVWTLALQGAGATILNLIPFSFQERRNGPTLRTDGRLALDAFQAMRSLR